MESGWGEGQSGETKKRGRTGNEMGYKDIVAHFAVDDQIHRGFGAGRKKMATHRGQGKIGRRIKMGFRAISGT